MRVADAVTGAARERLAQDAAAPAMLASDATEPPRTPRSIWPLATLGAVLIHVGCGALAFTYLQPEEASEDLGAPAIEIGLELEAPHHDPVNLPPGPDADASTASPEVMEQKKVVEHTDLPKATPTETDDPDRVVAPQEMKKPEDDTPQTPTTAPTAPSNASAAAEATAMPSPQTAQDAPRSVAPSPGTGESLRRERATWQKELAAHLDKYRRYPADRSHQSAEIVLRFVLDRAGHVLSAEVKKSSGDSAFDAAALAAVRRADPVPAPPPLVSDDALIVTLPVLFQGKERK